MREMSCYCTTGTWLYGSSVLLVQYSTEVIQKMTFYQGKKDLELKIWSIQHHSICSGGNKGMGWSGSRILNVVLQVDQDALPVCTYLNLNGQFVHDAITRIITVQEYYEVNFQFVQSTKYENGSSPKLQEYINNNTTKQGIQARVTFFP